MTRWKGWSAILLFLLLFCFKGEGQSYFISLDRKASHLWERNKVLEGDSASTAVRPFEHTTRWMGGADSSLVDYTTYRKGFGDWNIWTSPVMDLGGGLTGNGFHASFGGGAEFGLDNGKNLVAYGRFHSTNLSPVSQSDFIEKEKVIPGRGKASPTSLGYSYSEFSGYLGYEPSDHFTLHLGKGKHQFGQGYRSLLLSGNAPSYPYLRLKTEVWNIEYINLYSMFRDQQQVQEDPGDFHDKYGAFHYLNWKVAPWMKLGLFETVIWQGQDTLSDRGFDPNYLNPLIFYRPVEYSQGSADNSLIGLDLQFTVFKRYQLYGQLVLDEFLLEEIRDNRGWWGNKYGWQAGIQAFDVFGLEGVDVRLEANTVRPFTYTHGSILQNYGHFSQPLAHPSGANFKEYLGILDYIHERWMITGSTRYAEIGRDPGNGQSFGQNIYRSYVDRAKEYNNYIGQGILEKNLTGGLEVSYLIGPESNLRAGLGYVLEKKNTSDTPSHYVQLSLRTGVFDSDFPF